MDAIPPGTLVVRTMGRDDVPAVHALAEGQGRNVAAKDYERFLALEGARGLVVARDGEVLGAATAMRYFEHGFLGPLVLRTDSDSAGIAVALLAHLIEVLQRDGVAVLDAEAARVEEDVLGRMGFQLVRRTLILERAAGEVAREEATRPMEARDLLDVGALDAAAAGFGRKAYIDALRRAFPDGARVVGPADEVRGFVVMRQAPRGLQIGPLVTQIGDDDAARALVRAAIEAAAGAAVVTLAPDEPATIGLLQGEGFREVGALRRLRAGAPTLPAEPGAREWAIGGRLTG